MKFKRIFFIFTFFAFSFAAMSQEWQMEQGGSAKTLKYVGTDAVQSTGYIGEKNGNIYLMRRTDDKKNIPYIGVYDLNLNVVAETNLPDDEECSFTLYQESEKDEYMIDVWNCIIDAVAYICRKIYEEQGADYFPEPIELVDEDTYSRLLAGYEKCMKQ